ncbi:MAG: T9SS type A sorting domain-containing protein, partial [Bacteroidota bacterium]
FYAYDLNTGALMQSGEAECRAEDTLIVFPKLVVYRAGIRKLRIGYDLFIPTNSVGGKPFTAILQPNPAREIATLFIRLPEASQLTVGIFDATGRLRTQYFAAQAGENLLPLSVGDLPPGLHFVQVADENGGVLGLKLVKE